ncbi:MAG TPA: hypothetical protein VJ696_09750, partial [Rhodanobacteraceae bacterium]|nr:hypothetical protein [Rhodanobacteraceae bacterium]
AARDGRRTAQGRESVFAGRFKEQSKSKLDSGLRRNDGRESKALGSRFRGNDEDQKWIPAFAGMTEGKQGARFPLSRERRRIETRN